LIDDYLAGQLTPVEREQFDRHYLASPVHQHRVAVARQLRLAAAGQVLGGAATSERTPPLSSIVRSWFEPSFALTGVVAAAVLVAIAMAAVWMVRARPDSRNTAPTVATNPSSPAEPSQPAAPLPSAPQPSPTILAIALAPAGVRGTGDASRVTIPAGTDRLAVHLESDGTSQTFSKARAVVQAVTGREVWRGPATTGVAVRAPALARIDVPTDRLPPDDYIVTLFEIQEGGTEIERFRYFLRIRAS
jgi:hypothetical protein